MFESRGFQSFFQPPEGYRTEEILLFTYSLNLVMLDEIIRRSEIIPFSKDEAAFVKACKSAGERVACYVQEDRSAGTLRCTPAQAYAYALMKLGAVKPVPHEGRSFHLKMWAILFQANGGGELLRLVISSRNLTRQNMLEGCIFLETDKFDRKPYPDLQGMMEMVNKDNPQMKITDKLLHADFSACLKSILPEGMTLASYDICTNDHMDGNNKTGLAGLFPAACVQFTAVSPFLGADMIAARMRGCSDVCVITRQGAYTDEIERLLKDKCRYIAADIAAEEPEEEDIDFEADEAPLHAKLYAFDFVKFSRLLIGSANFTANGLAPGGNDELLVKIDAELTDPAKGFSALLRAQFDGRLKACVAPVQSGGNDFPAGRKFDQTPAESEALEAELRKVAEGVIARHCETVEWETLQRICGCAPRSGEAIVDYLVRCLMDPDQLKKILNADLPEDRDEFSDRLKTMLEELRTIKDTVRFE